MGHRTERVGKVIQQELTRLLQRGALKDPRIADFTTITAVKVTGDLSQAKVYFSVMGDDEAVATTARGLGAAAGFLHRHLAHVLTTRTVPALTFHHDASIAYGDRIERLLSSLPELEKPEAGGGDEAEEGEASADEDDGDDGSERES